MASSATYNLTIVTCLSVLALFGIILGGIGSRLAVRAWNLNGYTGRAASALLAFDGFFTFLWAIILIIVIVCVGNVTKRAGKWIAGPIFLMLQVFLIWALFLAGSAALSSRRNNFNCTWRAGLWRSCNSLYSSALAFGWMSWILLTFMLIFLPYFIITGFEDDEGPGYNRGSLETGSEVKNAGPVRQPAPVEDKAHQTSSMPQSET